MMKVKPILFEFDVLPKYLRLHWQQQLLLRSYSLLSTIGVSQARPTLCVVMVPCLVHLWQRSGHRSRLTPDHPEGPSHTIAGSPCGGFQQLYLLGCCRQRRLDVNLSVWFADYYTNPLTCNTTPAAICHSQTESLLPSSTSRGGGGVLGIANTAAG